MKKYYFFSASKLKFIEIKNYRRKFISLVVLISSLISFFIFAIYFIINVTINPNSQLKQVISENKILKNKLVNLKDNLIYFSDKFDSLSLINNELRLANNLEPITVADRNIGIGGAIFSASNISTNSELNEVISTLDNYVQMIETKLF